LLYFSSNHINSSFWCKWRMTITSFLLRFQTVGSYDWKLYWKIFFTVGSWSQFSYQWQALYCTDGSWGTFDHW
jgi:hypothetical protein